MALRMTTVGRVLTAIVLTLLVLSGPALAGGIINKQNQSSDYMRSLARNAATDYADIAVYNPAGIMRMEDGLYGKVDLLYFNKDYYNDVPGFGELDQNEPSLIPGAFIVYKQARWAGYFAFTIPAGGGQLNYEDGNARTIGLGSGVARAINAGIGAPIYNQVAPGSLEVKQSTVYGFTLGGSYAVNPMWSLSAGLRYATGTREFDGHSIISSSAGLAPSLDLRLNLEEEAAGWAGILGVHFAPNDKLDTALTFISNTKMEYEIDVKKDTRLPNGARLSAAIGFPEGFKRRIDVPGLLGFGLSYKVSPKLKLDLNYTLYLEKSAAIETYEDEGDSWDLAVAGTYAFTPRWKASLGYMRTDLSIADNQQINEPEEPKLDANTFAAGVVWTPTRTMAVTLGGAYVTYDDVKDRSGIEYGKTVWNMAVGVQYKFF